jgi:hypothetical protein
MTKFEVSDAMVEAAVKQYVALMPFKVDPPTYKAMRAAITAALEASGLLEEVAEAEAEITRLRQSLADIANGTNSWFNHAEEALLNARSRVRSEAKKALNKEPTP